MKLGVAAAAITIALITGCSAPKPAPMPVTPMGMADSVPLLAEHSLEPRAEHQVISVPPRSPTTALGVDVPQTVHIRAIRVTFEDGAMETVTTKTHGRVYLPGPPRQLREVELIYAAAIPEETSAMVRLFDLSVPEELELR